MDDRRPETKQGIEGKIVRFRLGKVTDRVRDKDRRSDHPKLSILAPDRRSEPHTVHLENGTRHRRLGVRTNFF